MIERRVSPREKFPISLTYKILNDQDYRQLMEGFDEKRERIVLYDQLDFKNRIVSLKLNNIDNELIPILSDINDQLKILKQTLSVNVDILYTQIASDVTINLGGMLFNTEEQLHIGTVIELQLKLTEEIPRLLIVAVVLRSKSGSTSGAFTTAIAFTYTVPGDKAILMDFVNKRLKDKLEERSKNI